MRLVPHTKFATYFLFFGILTVLVVAVLVQMMIEKQEIAVAEKQVSAHFLRFESYERPKKLPPVRFAGPSGDITGLEVFRGRYVVVNLWATWCKPCVEELPDLGRLQRMMRGRGVEVIAVSVDRQKDLEKIEAFLGKYKIGSFARYHDIHRELQEALKLGALPVTYILDPRGRIIYKIGGKAKWDSTPIITFLNKIKS